MFQHISTVPGRSRRVVSAPLPVWAVVASALIAPEARAQAIDDITRDASTHISSGFSYGLNAFCFIGGAILLAISVMGWWQHQRNPNAGARPGMIIAGFICGGILLAFPFLAKTASYTIFDQAPSVTGDQAEMKFDK